MIPQEIKHENLKEDAQGFYYVEEEKKSSSKGDETLSYSITEIKTKIDPNAPLGSLLNLNAK